MTSNEFVREENGDLRCDMCGFVTVHVFRMQNHMVKSHGHEAYLEPPMLAEKWRTGEDSSLKRADTKVRPYGKVLKKKEVKDGSDNAD